MRSEKLVQEQKKEFSNFFDFVEGLEKDKESSMPFFTKRAQASGETAQGIEEPFAGDLTGKNQLFREYQLKDKLFWLFIEYFFLDRSVPLKELMEGLERSIILRTMLKVNGNQRKAAKILKIKYSTLNEKIKRYNIRFRINAL